MPPSTDAGPFSSLTETLANLPIFWILILVAGLTVFRAAVVRRQTPLARSITETLETALVALTFVFLLIRPFIAQAFYIPTASMEPTLLGNSRAKDRILVSKFQYRLHPPQRDDVVVFLAPPAALPGDKPFVKRLIGLPGDRVEAVAGFISVGGTRYSHADIRQALAVAGEFGPDAQTTGYVDQADHHVKFVPDGILADKRLIGKPRLAEILTGKARGSVAIHPGYNIRNGVKLSEPFIAEDPDYDMKFYRGKPLKHEHDTSEAEFKWNGLPISQAEFQAEWHSAAGPVPAGHYLMMGDNRNDSDDGTNWGPLEDWRLVGPARLVFWPPSDMGVVH